MSELKNLISISKSIGKKPDYFQGGGGNISVKLNDQLMAVKASGFRVSEIREDKAIISVDFNEIKNIIAAETNDNLESNNDYENFLTNYSNSSLRPSIETGLHSVLGRYVIHCHSVYANIINCSVDSENLVKKISQESCLNIELVPYLPPGIILAKKIKEKADKNSKIIFLQNHGLIVSGDCHKEAKDIHKQINSSVKSLLEIDSIYPEIKLKKISEDKYISQTEYLKKFIGNHPNEIMNFTKNILFPDQAVFCESITINNSNKKTDKKIIINTDEKSITYQANLNEAMSIEEVIVSWAFIMENAKRIGLQLNTLSEKEVDFINNMGGEKYRKKLLNKKGTP